MADGTPWDIRHPVLTVALAAVAVASVPLVSRDFPEAAVSGLVGALLQFFVGRADRAAFERGGTEALRAARRRRVAVLFGAGVLLLAVLIVGPLLLA